MNQLFDRFGNSEIPYMILCNPFKQQLYSLGLAYDTKITLRFNALSEFTFSFPESIDGNATLTPAYEYIQNKRLVLVDGYGYFQIVDVTEDSDGAIRIKQVKCLSLECELIQKKVTSYKGTKKLYDPVSPTGTVLHDLLQLCPTWTVGSIDGSLIVKYRTLDISDSNVYNVLVETASKAFDCIFVFDTVAKTISVKSVAGATTATDIFLSFDNLIENAEFSEKSDEISTALSVYGGNNLTIRGVNPLGTNTIYNFDYYATTDWMSAGLISAIQAWKAVMQANQANYASLLSSLRTRNAELITLQGQLRTLESQYTALETVQKTRIQGGQSYADINAQLAAKLVEINSKQTEITNKTSQIATINANITAINNAVSFESNFTALELSELDSFIYENTYQNENIIKTDSMTSVELQDAEQDLYNQGAAVLSKVSQPRYEITINTVNFLSLSEFATTFTSQLDLGCLVTIELKNGTYVTTALLEIEFQFDDPNNFKLTFSNRLRLDGQNYIYSDLQGQIIQTGGRVSFNSGAWSNWEDNYKNDVSTFITSSLNAAVNTLISNTNQEIKIDRNGLRGRSITASGTYDPKQVWLTNNMLAFSDNGFQTAKLALGAITGPNGGTVYGLVADVIVGRLLAGNALTITNDRNNFTLDSTGATLNNAKFTTQTTNSKIIIDPTSTNSFVIQKNQGGTFVNKFTVNNAGDVVFGGVLSGATGNFTGNISAASGNLGNLIIDANGLRTADGINYLRGNGDLKWGQLSITGGDATFTGTIFADKIFGQVVNDQIAEGLDAGKLTVGFMSADRIYGGTIEGITISGSTILWPGVAMYGADYGLSMLEFGRLELIRNDRTSNIILDDKIITISTGYTGGSLGSIVVQTNYGVLEINETYLYSNVSGDGGYGYSDKVAVSTPSGTRYYWFDNGILTNITTS